jgi:DNA-binding GntR family transcriptional regulator
VEELRELFSIRLALETIAVRRAAELFEPSDADAAGARLAAYTEARATGDTRTGVSEHTAFHFALYDAARSSWLARLIRPTWDSCERYRPVLLAAHGALQDEHEELDRELLAACTAHDPDRAAAALHAHLELATKSHAVELQGRSIFAF